MGELTKQEVQNLIEQKFELIQKDLKSNYNQINLKLDYIKEQTTATNSRTTKNETEIRELQRAEDKHYVSCPQLPIIKEIQTDILKLKKYKTASKAYNEGSNKAIAKIVAITALVFAGINILIQLFI